MAKREGDFATNVDVWNIADGYVKLKILHPLVECDKLEKIALFGCESIDQSFMIQGDLKTEMRLDAIQRFIQTLKIVLENTLRLLNKPSIKYAETISKRIKTVEKAMENISYEKTNTLTKKKEKIINEKHFNNCMDVLRFIKTDIPKPLKNSKLIFPPGDELDLDAIKDKLILGG